MCRDPVKVLLHMFGAGPEEGLATGGVQTTLEPIFRQNRPVGIVLCEFLPGIARHGISHRIQPTAEGSGQASDIIAGRRPASVTTKIFGMRFATLDRTISFVYGSCVHLPYHAFSNRMSAPLEPAKPERSAIEALIRNRLLKEAEAVPENAGPVAARHGRASRRKSMVRILKNLSEHLRSFRLMTATRLRTQEIEALIDELGLTPEMMGAMQDKVRRLSGEARNFSRQIEQNTELIDAYKARIAQYREEIADLNSIVDLQRKSYVGITRQLAKTANDVVASNGKGKPTVDADPFLDVFQQELEQDRRGSSDETRHRLRHYLAHIDFLADLKKPKVVDLGSEAGEWVKMLAERGQPVTGVFPREADAFDIDADKDTEIVISDPLVWMQEQKDRSVDPDHGIPDFRAPAF